MTISLWCLVVAAFMPPIVAMMIGMVRMKQLGMIDNKNPRAQYRELKGIGARMVAAQENSWESLMFFTVFVLIAHVTRADTSLAGFASIGFIISRIFYVLFYALNRDILRSISFTVGVGCCLYMLYLSVYAVPVA